MKALFVLIALSALPARAETLTPIQGALCVQASVEKLARLAGAFPEWTKIPESTYKVAKFQLIKLASAQTAPWDQAVAASAPLSALPEAERASRLIPGVPGIDDQFAFFFFQPGTLGKDWASVYPRFAARCTGRLTGNSFRQECSQVRVLERFGVDSFDSVIEAAASDACPAGQVSLRYDIRITLNDAEVKRTRDALLGGFSVLAGALASPATFIRGYFENFYPGWKAYAEKP